MSFLKAIEQWKRRNFFFFHNNFQISSILLNFVHVSSESISVHADKSLFFFIRNYDHSVFTRIWRINFQQRVKTTSLCNDDKRSRAHHSIYHEWHFLSIKTRVIIVILTTMNFISQLYRYRKQRSRSIESKKNETTWTWLSKDICSSWCRCFVRWIH